MIWKFWHYSNRTRGVSNVHGGYVWKHANEKAGWKRKKERKWGFTTGLCQFPPGQLDVHIHDMFVLVPSRLKYGPHLKHFSVVFASLFLLLISLSIQFLWLNMFPFPHFQGNVQKKVWPQLNRGLGRSWKFIGMENFSSKTWPLKLRLCQSSEWPELTLTLQLLKDFNSSVQHPRDNTS